MVSGPGEDEVLRGDRTGAGYDRPAVGPGRHEARERTVWWNFAKEPTRPRRPGSAATERKSVSVVGPYLRRAGPAHAVVFDAPFPHVVGLVEIAAVKEDGAFQ